MFRLRPQIVFQILIQFLHFVEIRMLNFNVYVIYLFQLNDIAHILNAYTLLIVDAVGLGLACLFQL